jgi:hypothetical protein
MLRFSFYRSGAAQHWVLCGQLSGPWVDELCSVWRRMRQQSPPVHTLVDLKDVTFIDEAGEQLLAEMQCGGAAFVATGVEHKDLVANLNCGGKRAVRRRMEHLCGGRS